MNVPAGGGDWQRDAKRASFNAVKGTLREAFEAVAEGEDLGRYGWASQLETLLGNALVEQQLFDCSKGSFRLGQVETSTATRSTRFVVHSRRWRMLDQILLATSPSGLLTKKLMLCESQHWTQ